MDEQLYKAEMLKARSKALKDIRTYIAQLIVASDALENEVDQETLLKHLRLAKPEGRIKAFRQAIKDKLLSYPHLNP
jgi:hypothetical protein